MGLRLSATTRAAAHAALGLALAAAGAAAAGCARDGGPAPAQEAPAPERPPNLVVVLVDTLRADHTGIHGYARDTTPHLRRIAAEGLTLRRHLVNAPWTKPSVASILTGLPPSAHGTRLGHAGRTGDDRPNETLRPELTTLAEVLSARGYATSAWVTNAHLRGAWGFGQGYDRYVFRRRPVPRGEMPEVDRRGIDFALETLSGSDRPAFVWVHLMGVHQYESPPEHRLFASEDPTPIDRRGRHAWRVLDYPDLGAVVAAYDNAIRAADAEIGRLYDGLRAIDPNTVLVVTSDHGEELYDHGGYDHGATLYNEILWVPCVLAGPGVPRGEAIDALTDSLDLLPTLAALAGVESAPGTDAGRVGLGLGRPLLGGGARRAGKTESLAEQHALGPFRRFSLLRRDGRKLIVSEDRKTGREVAAELYGDGHRIEGAALDPAAHAETIDEMRRRIAGLRERSRRLRAAAGGTAEQPLDEEDRARLRALGYLR